jgi:hypothetical protein
MPVLARSQGYKVLESVNAEGVLSSLMVRLWQISGKRP